MNLIRATKHFFQDPAYKIVKFALHFVPAAAIPDKLFLKYQFHYVFGYRLDLKHPKTFNEKLQWLKLYDRNPLYTTLVDKYAVKQWVADKIGEQYVIPTLAVYDSVDEICWDDLPKQFVMKCTHDSGGLIICKNKKPTEEMLELAEENNMVVITSEHSMFKVCGLLYAAGLKPIN